MKETSTLPATESLDERTARLKAKILSQNARDDSNAWLSSWNPARGFGKHELYPLGFKMASDELIDHLLEDYSPSHWNEAMVYPIFFGYRHYVELRMKNQIRRFSGFPTHGSQGHGLLTLWNHLRRLAEKQYGEDRFTDQFDETQCYVQVLHELDDRSFSFRYPDADFPVQDEDTEFGVVNLANLKEHVAQLSNLMDKLGLS